MHLLWVGLRASKLLEGLGSCAYNIIDKICFFFVSEVSAQDHIVEVNGPRLGLDLMNLNNGP